MYSARLDSTAKKQNTRYQNHTAILFKQHSLGKWLVQDIKEKGLTYVRSLCFHEASWSQWERWNCGAWKQRVLFPKEYVKGTVRCWKCSCTHSPSQEGQVLSATFPLGICSGYMLIARSLAQQSQRRVFLGYLLERLEWFWLTVKYCQFGKDGMVHTCVQLRNGIESQIICFFFIYYFYLSNKITSRVEGSSSLLFLWVANKL